MTFRVIPLDGPGEQYRLIHDGGRTSRVWELGYDQLLALSEEVATVIEPHDRHHTISELYTYRMLYNAHAANEWASNGTYPVVKSWNHSDGEPCFGGGWFIVVVTLPEGQVSNHYKAEHWDLFNVPAVDLPPEYDNHTPQDASSRLYSELTRRAHDRWFD